MIWTDSENGIRNKDTYTHILYTYVPNMLRPVNTMSEVDLPISQYLGGVAGGVGGYVVVGASVVGGYLVVDSSVVGGSVV